CGCARAGGGFSVFSVFASPRSRSGNDCALWSLQSLQKCHKFHSLLRREHGAARVFLFLEDFIQRPRSAVVQERAPATDTAKRRRIELAVANLVSQADIVPLGRRVVGAGVARGAFASLEYRSPSRDLGRIWSERARHHSTRRRQRLEIGLQVG